MFYLSWSVVAGTPQLQGVKQGLSGVRVLGHVSVLG